MPGVEPLVVDEWIASTLLADPTLQGLLGNDYADRIWSDVAPEEQSGTVVVIQYQQDGRDDMGVGPARWAFTGTWVVKAIAEGTSYEPVRAIAVRVDQLLHGASGNVASGQVLACVRDNPVRYPEQANDRQYRHLGGAYRVQAQ